MSFRFEVTESFSITGRGTVVVGRVEGGPVEGGQQVRMRTPDGEERTVHITFIQVRGRTVPRAEPGDEVGLLLRGVERPPVGTVLESLDTGDTDTDTDADPGPDLEDVELTSNPTALPLLLLPLRLETSFEGRTLRIRAYPDQIHVDSFDPRLTEDEVTAGELYLAARADGRSRAAARESLAEALGPIRAQLVADRADEGGADALQVESDGGLNRRAVARGLPGKLIAHGVAGDRSFTVEGRPIPAEVPVAPGENDHVAPGGGGALDWMVDFSEAEAIGLALTLDLDDDAAQQGLDRLYVFGVDGDRDGERIFAQLMRAHAGTGGATTLSPLTPTKGSPQQAPVYALKESQPEGVQRLTRAVGLAGELPLSRPADEDSTALARMLATIVWEASLRPALRELYGAGDDLVAHARDVYIDEVHPFGPYPTLRIGDQPYGMAPVSLSASTAPRRADDLLRHVGDAIRAALPAVSEAAGNARSGGGDPPGYPWMVETLLQRPIGQHWRIRSRTAAEAYLTPIARATRSGDPTDVADASDVANALMDDIRQGRLLLDALDLPVDPEARLLASVGDAATPSVCGPLVAVGADEDRTADPLRDRGITDLTTKSAFWSDRVDSSPRETPYYEDEARGAEPVLRLFAENAVLQVLGDLAVAENLATDRDRELVERGVLDPDTAVLPTEAWYLRSRLAAAVEQRVGGGSLEDIVAGFTPETPEGRTRWFELKLLHDALRRVNDAPAGGTHAVFAALLDTLSTRADAWLMAEAEQRLAREREAGRTGVKLGGWGIVERVRPGEPSPTRHATAPSQEFATTLGLLERARRGLETTGLDGAIRAELSGPRVSEARDILDLLRQGRAIDAALSRRIAEKLNAAGRGRLMEHIVAEMPPEGGAVSGVECDGLEFLHRPNFRGIEGVDDGDRDLLTRIRADLVAAMETLGELHLVEGAAALAQRRVEAGQAVLQGLSAGSPPSTDLSVLDPSSVGATLDFSVVACVDLSDPIAGHEDLRTRLTPGLAVIAERLLGPMDGTIEVAGSGEPPLALADLGLSALSLAHLAAPGTDGEDRLVSYVRARRGLDDDARLNLDDDARSTLWAASRLAAALGESRPLEPDDTATEAEVTADTATITSARQAAETELVQLRDGLPAADTASVADAAPLFAAGLIPAPDPTLIEDARTAIDARLARAAEVEAETGDPLAALAALTADMPALPALTCADPRPWEDGPMLQGASRGELFVWLEESGAVRARLAPVADLLLGAEGGPLDVRAVQWPGTIRPSRHQQVDWIGAELREDDVFPARSSFVVLGGGAASNGAFAGLLFDTWQEVVPDHTVTAGVVVDSPTPRARPPQLMVLAAPAGGGADWTSTSLMEVLETTVAIARMRTIGLGSLPEEAPHNGVLGRLGQILPVGGIRPTDTALSRATCPPTVEG